MARDRLFLGGAVSVLEGAAADAGGDDGRPLSSARAAVPDREMNSRVEANDRNI
jgi:hypothetical protein